MNSKAEKLLNDSKNWLKLAALPLWAKVGFDSVNGSFFESMNGTQPQVAIPRRAMVQARQIYSFSEALKIDQFQNSSAINLIQLTVDFLISKYSQSSGAFAHSVGDDGKVLDPSHDLYSQAFVLFGLARAYEVLRRPEIKSVAEKLESYLVSSRRNRFGGFTEVKGSQLSFESNPHMHLFESAIEWARVDGGDRWLRLAEEIRELCTGKLIDKDTGVIPEQFTADWSPLLQLGRFQFEPGHQYEWAWLLVQYRNMTGRGNLEVPRRLFKISEQFGLRPGEKLVVDEVWNDFEIKRSSSRFWPQCERVKAAVEIGIQMEKKYQAEFANAADDALLGLMRFLRVEGTWEDSLLENGEFSKQATKASSLYHIVNAISVYAQKRPGLFDKI